jgi:hypothetical protein
MATARLHGPVPAHPPERRKVQRKTLNRITNWPRSSLYWISCRRVTGAGKSQVTSAREKASARRSAPKIQVHRRTAVTPAAARSSTVSGLTSADPDAGRCRTPTYQR